MGNDARRRFRGTSLVFRMTILIRWDMLRSRRSGQPAIYAGVRRKLTGGKSTSSPQLGHFTQQEPWLPR